MKSLLPVLLLPTLILAACGGDATESEPTQPAEPTPTQAASPLPEPTPTPDPPGDPTPEPSPTFSAGDVILPTVPVPLTEPDIDDLISKRLASAGIRTNNIRGLTLSTVTEREYVTPDDFRDLVAGVFESRRDKIEADQLLYETLRLMEPDGSLYDILLTFNTEGVLSWFDPDNEKLYFVRESDEFTPAHERTYANEYVHYLQAANFDIRTKLEATAGNDDAGLALRAVMEGDSAIAEFLYANEHFTPEEQQASVNEPNEAFLEALNMAPYVAIRTFVFPYAEGLDFALGLFRSAGDWSAINQTLETPPASTEQVLHLEKYAAGELPVKIDMPDLQWVLGDGWKHVRTGVLGELFILAWLETDFSPQAAAIASTGWGGDAYSLFEDSNGRGVLVLAAVWDSEQDAQEFFATVQQHNEARSGVAWEDSPLASQAVIVSSPDWTVYAERNGERALQIYAPNPEIVETLRQAVAEPLGLE